MNQMFSGCQRLTNLDVSNFNTSRVTNMSLMFSSCFELTNLDLSSFDTNSVTNMRAMFKDSNKLTAIYVGTKWKIKEETNIDEMFSNCGTSNVTPKTI